MKYIYHPFAICRYFLVILVLSSSFWHTAKAQVTPNINSGNPAFPFPQFLDYGPDRKSLASHNAPGMTHAEMEQRTREAWQLVCNNTSPYPGAVVSGVQYLYPTAPNHCRCVEGDGYYLLGAALMGDKTFFDGYFMWAHDRGFNGVKRYIDGVMNDYNGATRGLHTAGIGDRFALDVKGGSANDTNGNNSATDGDVDFALALLIAYKQWGEHSGIILTNDGWGGKEINYKEEALNYIKAMVDTSYYAPSGNVPKYLSGNVGLDGYLKAGDFGGELTNWASGGYNGIARQVGTERLFADYMAPAWFRNFRFFLEQENERPFLINQYKRVEASCDWLMGLHYSKDIRNIPVFGHIESGVGNDFIFKTDGRFAEDMRGSWRTIMNYLWHGNPTESWNPITHEVDDNTPNTYEYDMAMRFARFLKSNQDAPWNNPCNNTGDLDPRITFKGPYTLRDGMTMEGYVNPGNFPLNWIHGAGAGSAIVAQDFELMGEMFRHCVIAWDAVTGTNLDSRPIYFHEWFRLAGMLTLAGNFHAPDKMVAQPNLKVYHKVDKTFGFTGDQVTFTVSYRNYGSVNAAGSVVKFGIPAGFEFVSANKSGALSGDSIVWNIGTVPGFKTGGLNATMDSVKVTLKIGPNASGRYCTNARIACSNGLGWTSDEYPNNITTVMERNCVDVVKRALKIEKTTSRKEVNPSSNPDIVYKIKFENSSDAGWINGGRPGVRLAFAHEDLATPNKSNSNVLKFRLFHDAAEPYIDYGNYRVSYFMNDNSIKGYSINASTATWGLQNTIAEGVDKDLVKVIHEQIVPGSDANGSWNQRLVLQFSPQVATITQHIQQYAGQPGSYIHEGGDAALRGVWRMYTNNNLNVDWTDDWSWDPAQKDDDGGLYFPISDDYTDPNNLGLPIDSWHRSACQTSNIIVKKILVEEWDGYVWRRVLGNGPAPGRDIPNVVVTDTLPQGVTFKNFIRQTALGIEATTTTLGDGRTVIKWSIPKMQVNQKDSLIFTATISGNCPGGDRLVVNRAWIEGNAESALPDSDTITVTCNAVTICPEPTTLLKSSDKSIYLENDPVTYTLDYTQNQGSIANPDLSTAADWTAQSGAMTNASFAAGKASIGQINGGNLVLTHDYSYGTNTLGDGIEGTIQITNYAKAAIVVRHSGRSYDDGVFVVIKPAYPSYVIVYNGTTKIDSSSLPINEPPSIDFRIKLTGSKLDLWIGATPSAFSGAPSMSFTGITVQPGWAGFSRGTTIGDPSGNGTISSWRTHMDAAFDVVVTDPVPSGITSPSDISNSGTINSGIITWNLALGKTPMLYGAKQELTWKGIYSSCEKVTNVAYINIRGLPKDNFGVCYDINCGTAPPVCTPPASATISGEELITEGSSTVLTATIAPLETDWVYNWYKLPNTTTPLAGSGLDIKTLTVSDSGRYVVRVVSSSTSSCFVESAEFKLVYIETCTPPNIATISGVDLISEGTSTILTATIEPIETGWIYNWYKLPDNTTPLTGSGIDKTMLTVSDSGRYVVQVVNVTDPSCNVLSTVYPVSYLQTCQDRDSVNVVIDQLLEFGKTTTLTATPYPAETGLNYQWYKLPYDLNTPLDGSGIDKVTFTVSDTGKYFVLVSDPTTCKIISRITQVDYLCEKAIIKAFWNGEVITEPYAINLCEGESGVLSFAPQLYDFEYDIRQLMGTPLLDGIAIPAGDSAKITISSANAGSWFFSVYSDPGNTGKQLCWEFTDTKVLTINKTNIPVPTITATPDSKYCAGENGVALTANTGVGYTYIWSKDGVEQTLGTQPNVQSNATKGNWKVKVMVGGLCADSTTLDVLEESKPIAEFATNSTTLSYCPGSPGTNLIAKAASGMKYQFLKDGSPVGPFSTTETQVADEGTWHVVFENTFGCSDTSNAVVVSQSSNIIVDIIGDTIVCSGQSLNLSTNLGAQTITWILPDNSTQEVSELVVSNPLSGLYKAYYEDGAGCSGESSVNVLIEPASPNPVVSILDKSPKGCVGDEIIFTAQITDASDPIIAWYINANKQTSTIAEFKSSSLLDGDKIKVFITSESKCNGIQTVGDSVQVVINPLPIVEISSTTSSICSGESISIDGSSTNVTLDTFEWLKNGNSFSSLPNTVTIASGGSYSLKGTDIDGCSGLSNVLIIEEISLPTVTISSPVTGVCDGTRIDISSDVTDQSYTYSWIDANDSDLGISRPVATISSAGSYRMVLKSGNCTSISNTIIIEDLVLETPLIYGNNTPLCEAEGETYTVTNLLSNAQYTWSLPSGSQIVSQNWGIAIVNLGDQDGVISVYATNSLGCKSPVGEIPVSLQLCGFKANIAFDKTSICPGETVIFESKSTGVSSGTTYQWNFGANATPSIYNQVGPIPVVFNNPGLVQVSLTITENGISSTFTSTDKITINSNPVISDITSPGMICLNTEAEFSATVSSNVQVQWTLSNNLTDQGIYSSSSVILKATQTGIGIIKAYALDMKGCYSETIEKSVTIEDKPSISLSSDRSLLCNDGEVVLVASSSGNDIRWYKEDQHLINELGDRIKVNTPGKYWVSIGSGNCIASDTVYIGKSGLAVDAGKDQMIDIGQSTQLLAISNSLSVFYHWEPGMSSLPAPTVSPYETTLYTVFVTDEHGCQANDDVLVRVVQPLFIPNAFTPNGDGVHDLWEISGLERYEKLSVEIFNRWGQLVYKSTGTYKPWDGTKNGVMMPVSTYYYVIDGGGDSTPITGAVLLSK